MPIIRSLGLEHAELASPLSEEAGWNQTLEDWRFMLGHGTGFGAWDGTRLAASALTLPLGPGVSWISMVLVTRDHRKAGLGTALLERCIESLRERGITPGLDATELGRPLYAKLGFHAHFTLSRWRLSRPFEPSLPLPDGTSIRPITPEDFAALGAFDQPRSGFAREAVLAYLAGRAGERAFVAMRLGEMCGYVLARPGRIMPQVGPLVADDAATAQALINAATRGGGPVMLDVPDVHAALGEQFVALGAVRERGFWRMTLGDAAGLGDPLRIFAVAGPELG